MRSFLITILAFSSLFLTACSKESDRLSTATQLIPVDSGIQLSSSGNTTLYFSEIVSDSRCPANSLCAWAGIAIARFHLKDGSGDYPFLLSLMPGYPKQDTIIRGYLIEFSDLRPYPGLPETLAGTDGVKAEIRVTKL